MELEEGYTSSDTSSSGGFECGFVEVSSAPKAQASRTVATGKQLPMAIYDSGPDSSDHGEDGENAAAAAAREHSVSVCATCQGADAALSDIEELNLWYGVRVESSGCMGACGAGPNAAICGPPTAGSHGWSTHELHTGLDTLHDCKRVLAEARARNGGRRGAAEGQAEAQVLPSAVAAAAAAAASVVTIPVEAERRLRLRSEAVRLAARRVYGGSGADGEQRRTRGEAVRLLGLAIADAETEQQQLLRGTAAAAAWRPPGVPVAEMARRSTVTLRKLRMARAALRAGLSETEGALQDYAAVIAAAPAFAQVHVEKGKVLRRIGRLEEALACFRRALCVGAAAGSATATATAAAAAAAAHEPLQPWAAQWVRGAVVGLQVRGWAADTHTQMHISIYNIFDDANVCASEINLRSARRAASVLTHACPPRLR
jgi:tetratricopeptide (TPR) repeat protein